METLRGDKGCPWDKKQTVKEFKTYLLEEVYELIDAIERDDGQALREELGDLLFHIVFITQICRERGLFDIQDVVSHTHEKMYHRHPHVFKGIHDGVSVEKRWEELKKEENADYSPLSHVPRIMPALLRAYVISRRASKAGFDWMELADVHKKMSEELEELERAERSGSDSAVREEVGDVLFTMVNIARFQRIDPEDALRLACDKFIRRFNYVEQKTDLKTASLAKMDELWDEAKAYLRSDSV